MAMSKRHYEAIAGAVFTARVEMLARTPYDGSEQTALNTLDAVVGHLALHLAADNPRFDRARFVEACETGACRGMRRAK